MKKFFSVLFLVVICAVIIAGCSSSGSGTKLTITNSTSFDLELVHWIDNQSKIYYFKNGQVYDNGVEDYVSILKHGTSVTQDVQPGNSYIYFYFIDVNDEYCTTEMISVSQGQKKTYTFTAAASGSAGHLNVRYVETVSTNKDLGPADFQEKKDELAKLLNSNQ